MGRALAKESKLNVGGLFPMSLLKEVLNKIKLRIQELDTAIPEDMIPCQNCVLQWNEGKGEFDRLDYSFKLAVPTRLDVGYDPDASAERFEYDKMEVIPFDKIDGFFRKYLGKK